MWPSGLKQESTKKKCYENKANSSGRLVRSRKKQANVEKTKQIHAAVWFDAKTNKKHANVVKTKRIHVVVWFDAKINKKTSKCIENKANLCGRMV